MLDLNPVYNYYTSVYTPKTTTKYDSHKKSELKTVYNNIVKSTAKSPLFKVNVNSNIQNYAIGLKSAAIELKNLSSYLSDEEEHAFSKLTTSSSNPKALTGTVITSDYSNIPASLDFTISNLAQTQVNTSHSVPAMGLNIDPGAYSFTIDMNKRSYSYNLSVKDNDTNTSVLQKLSSFMNQSNIGIDTYLQTDGPNINLVIESDDTGLESANNGHIFTLTDNAGHEEGIVSKFGLDQMSQAPADANFTINHTPMTSSSNNIAINKMVEVELKNIANEPVTLSFVPDTENIIQNLKQFASSYNSVIDIANDHSDNQRGAKKLLHEISGIANHNLSALESAGLSINDDGRMQTDDALLTQSVQNGNIKQLFNDLSSFKNEISRKTDNISLDPMNYVDKTVITYPNPKHTITNPYVPSIYSGMLYNYYV